MSFQVQCFFRGTPRTPIPKINFRTTQVDSRESTRIVCVVLVLDDLTNLNIVNGQCYNTSIPQNVTFREGLPFGSREKGGASRTELG